MMPNGWKITSLKEATVKIQDGNYGASYPKKEELLPSGIPFLTSKVLGGEGKINTSKYDYISLEKHAELKKAQITTDDILFTNRGANVGTVAMAGKDLADANIGPQLTLIRANEQVSDKKYLYLFMKSNYFLRQVHGQDSGSAMNFFGIKSTEKFKVILPSLPEQRKIAKILSTWDKAISTTERLIDNSKQQKKALMQQLLTGKKRLLDDSGKPFEGEWTHGYLGDLCVFKGGSAFKEVYQGNSTGEIPFIKVSDMNLPQNGKFICEANNWVTKDIAKEMKAKGFPKGAVVFAKVGAALLLNRRRILTRETIIDNNMMAATPLDSATTEFLYQIMLAIDFAKFVQDGAVPSVNQSDLSKFKLTYPKRIEQEKIASVLANADQEIELLEQQLADLKQEKKALMQQLLTGKRRVKI